MEAEATVKKWGSSLGIILPKLVVDNLNISNNDKIIVTVKKKVLAKEFFGILHDWKKPTDVIKKEMKKGW